MWWKKNVLSAEASGVSFTAHYTSYVWYRNQLSHQAFTSPYGRLSYYGLLPLMWLGKNFIGLADFETMLLQRHVIMDHLLENAVVGRGIKQVFELASGFSPRGFRFMHRHQSQDFIYVEADLEPVAQRKRKLLQENGLTRSNHHVVPGDILEEQGDLSLQTIAHRYFNPELPLAVITEGLVNYFDYRTISDFWRRIAQLLQSHTGGIYLSEYVPDVTGLGNNVITHTSSKLLQVLTGGDVSLHFQTDQEAEQAFINFGFSNVGIHIPEDFSSLLAIPVTRKPSFMRIIEAIVFAGNYRN